VFGVWWCRYLDSRAARVVLGGVSQSPALLDMPFNHIFYTGGSQVGSVVMTAAAKRLTPVTLELGGKSPAIVAADANMAITARRILNVRCFCGVNS
jgi:aldehyde dehydrogenase (NAD+)